LFRNGWIHLRLSIGLVCSPDGLALQCRSRDPQGYAAIVPMPYAGNVRARLTAFHPGRMLPPRRQGRRRRVAVR
jgi:hypothetical protein